ncbi:hypothetical protein [Bdellovibrio sp. HCB337]|uniref:hypothetical protein n=1 Tax=Bdellovibrio sp. HCB337 TaxID=3394358 RepID=UPI0039A40888
MKKVFSLALVGLIIASEPLMAAAPDSGGARIPEQLSKIGLTEADLKDVGSAVQDEPTSKEADIMQRWRRRYCPRGYRLVVYRVRIGRFIVTRYRCVRRRYRRDYDDRYYSAPAETQKQTPAEVVE